TLYRLGLLGHEDRAHAAFADLLEQLVRPDHCAGALAERVIDGGGRTGGFQEAPEPVVFPEQRPNTLTQVGVASARFVEEGSLFGGILLLTRRDEDFPFVHGMIPFAIGRLLFSVRHPRANS